MKEYIVTCDFVGKYGVEQEEIRAYGFLRRHAEMVVRNDNNRTLLLVRSVREAA